MKTLFFNDSFFFHGNNHHFADWLNRVQFYQGICFTLKRVSICHGIGYLHSQFFFRDYKVHFCIFAVPKITAITIFASECYRYNIFKQRRVGIYKEKI